MCAHHCNQQCQREINQTRLRSLNKQQSFNQDLYSKIINNQSINQSDGGKKQFYRKGAFKQYELTYSNQTKMRTGNNRNTKFLPFQEKHCRIANKLAIK
jgi:hypothetical protein